MVNTLNCETYSDGMWKCLVLIGSENGSLALNAKISLELKNVCQLPFAEVGANVPRKLIPVCVRSSVIFYWTFLISLLETGY